MKVMHAARMTRAYLLITTGYIARLVTYRYGSEKNDILLYRLTCHPKSKLPYFFVAWTSDRIEDVSLVVRSYADVAISVDIQRLTARSMPSLGGPNTRFPLNLLYQMQSYVSHSSPQAERVAMNTLLKSTALPAFMIWEVLCPDIALHAFGCNEAMLQILKMGRSPTMRHLRAELIASGQHG